VSAELRALVERMLSRDRGDRPRDAAEVRQALAFPAAATEAARTVPPPAAREATPRWGAAGIVVAMLAAGGLGVWAMAGTGTSRWHAPGERNDGRALRTATTTPAATPTNDLPPVRALPPLSTRAPGRPVASTSPTNTAELPGNVQRHSPY